MVEKANLAKKTVVTTCDSVISILDGTNYVMVEETQNFNKVRFILDQIVLTVKCCIQAEKMLNISIKFQMMPHVEGLVHLVPRGVRCSLYSFN